MHEISVSSATHDDASSLAAIRVVVMAEHLVAASRMHGEVPPERGATAGEITRIQSTFTLLSFPLPDELIEVYRVTLAIPGVTNDLALLSAPCFFDAENGEFVSHLATQEEDVDRAGVLFLGEGNDASLFIDRDGMCGVDSLRTIDGRWIAKVPMTFPEAFCEFARRQIDDIKSGSDAWLEDGDAAGC